MHVSKIVINRFAIKMQFIFHNSLEYQYNYSDFISQNHGTCKIPILLVCVHKKYVYANQQRDIQEDNKNILYINVNKLKLNMIPYTVKPQFFHMQCSKQHCFPELQKYSMCYKHFLCLNSCFDYNIFLSQHSISQHIIAQEIVFPYIRIINLHI